MYLLTIADSAFMTIMLSILGGKYEVSSRLFFCLPGPVMMSLKPGSQVAESYPEMNKGMGNLLDGYRGQSRSATAQRGYIQDQLRTIEGAEDGNRVADDAGQTAVVNGDGYSLCSPPRTENEVRGLLRFVWEGDSSSSGFKTCVFILSTAAHEVPQAAGGDPTFEGAAQPEGRAHQAAGAGD